MTSPETETDGLDGLRRDLARLVLDEAGRAVAREPGLPLSTAMVEAVGRQASEAAERERQRTPDAEALAASVLATLRPDLIRIVQAASSGDTRGLGTGATPIPGALGIGLAVAAAILLFAAGFVTARLTAPVPEPTPAAWPVVTGPPGTEGGQSAPAEGAIVVPDTAQSARTQTSGPSRSGTPSAPTPRPGTTGEPRARTPASTSGEPVATQSAAPVTGAPPA